MSKLVCLDFDGVLHSYSSGWKGPRVIPDPPVPGAIKWLNEFVLNHCAPQEIVVSIKHLDFSVCIHSSRSRYLGGRRAMKKWLLYHSLEPIVLDCIGFPLFKPPAFITIDDRALTFIGTFPSVDELRRFKPWNKQGLKC